MQITLSKHAVKIIFKTPFLKLVIVVYLVTSTAFFLIQEKGLFPVFRKTQFESIESEATRTARHLQTILDIQTGNKIAILSNDVQRKLQEAMKDFELVKMKIFDSSGVVLHSSDSREIGEINTHDYFQEKVAKGQVFSKIVEKDSASMEGKIVPVSVAEIYVPIISNNVFSGAFEIYYDITDQNKKIERNEFVFKSASFLIWLTVTLIFFSLLIKASRAHILKLRAERELTDTNQWLENTVIEKTREIKVTQMVSVQALATLAEHYDPDTGEHLERIQLYVKTLLEYLSTSSNEYSEYIQRHPSYIEEVVFASLLHDIGKTAIPVEILTKPAKLTDEEFEIIKGHTTIAGESLNKANELFKAEFGKDSFLALARDIALHHHEKWNGEGYPNHLKGIEIPLSARITAIADVYDALTSERPYKKAWSHEKAFEEIVRGSGSHFEPELIEAFKNCAEQFKNIAENTI